MARSSKGPVSVVLPEDLRRAVEREAQKRGLGLSPALRVLAAERLREIAEEAELTKTESWQRAQAWASWDDPDNAPVEWTRIEAGLDAPTRKRS